MVGEMGVAVVQMLDKVGQSGVEVGQMGVEVGYVSNWL